MVSLYLTTTFSLNCVVIDPRGLDLPKKHRRTLRVSNKKIEEIKCYFDDNIDENLLTDKSCVLLIGMHPDEATVPIVQIAEKYKKPFAVVPCCVFPSKFGDRVLKNGENVVDYLHLIKYIEEISSDVSTSFLQIQGRNRILYKKKV